MDYIPESMFQYDQLADHELFQISSIPCQLDTKQLDQLPVMTTCQNGCNLNHKLEHSRRHKASISYDEIDDDNAYDNIKKKKKIIHRDIERQRRHEIATLYAFLRSLVPAEYIKGKRSISDHINEVVNYIKHLQKKIQELNNKRKEVKRLSNYTTNATENLLGSMWDSVEVRSSCAGVEVVITARQGLPLSRVLEVLMGEGLNIVSFISTKVNQRLLHTIESELSNGQIMDLRELQKKLTNFIISNTSTTADQDSKTGSPKLPQTRIV